MTALDIISTIIPPVPIRVPDPLRQAQMLRTSPCKNKVIQFIFSESLSNLFTWSCPVLARHSNVTLVCEKDFSRVPLVAMSDVKFQVYAMADPYVGQTVNGARRRNNHDVRPSGKIADLTVEQKAGDTWRCLTLMTKVDDFALRCELLDLFEYLWIAALGINSTQTGWIHNPSRTDRTCYQVLDIEGIDLFIRGTKMILSVVHRTSSCASSLTRPSSLLKACFHIRGCRQNMAEWATSRRHLCTSSGSAHHR